jgi:hypothetical protein
MHPDYPTDCPLCGRQLTPIAHAHGTAPWQCFPCMRGWFVCELRPEARQHYVHHQLCYHWDVVPLILDAMQQELAEAALRGTSLRLDQVLYAHSDYLNGIKDSVHIDKSYSNLIKAELLRRAVR